MPDNEFFESLKEQEEGFADCENQSESPFEQGFQEKQKENTVNHTYVTYIPYGMTPKTYEERQAVKRSSRAAGGAFLLLQAVILVLSFILTFVFGIIQGALGLSTPLMNDPAVLQAMQIFLSLTVFTLPFIIVYKISGYRISDLISFKKPKENTFLPFFFFGIGFCAFANIATSFASSFFENIGIEYDVTSLPIPEGVFGFLLCVISTVIVPAFVEEFACRGIVLGSLRKYGDSFAIIVSAVLFGLMHGNFQQIPFAFLVGLVLGFVTVKSCSIWIAIAIHAFNNGFSVMFEYFLANTQSIIQNVIFIIFLCISMLLGILGLLLLNHKDIYSMEEPEFESSPKKRYKWFFLSAFTLIFIIIMVIEAFAFFV